MAAVWEVVAKLDPTGLARIVCGRQWVDEGFLKQQFVFDPRVFFPPSRTRSSTATSMPSLPPHSDSGSSFVDSFSDSLENHSDGNHGNVNGDMELNGSYFPLSESYSSTAAFGLPPSISTSPSHDPHSPTVASNSNALPPYVPHAVPSQLPTHLPHLSRTSVEYLYSVLDEWAEARDRDKLAKFIYLCTNSVYIPWGGLGDGVFVVGCADKVIHAHGCCNILHLPEKESYKAFRDMMEDMVRNLDSWIYQLV